MALPDTVRVKLSSEDAGFVSITPVVIREMPVRELIELMLGAAGKNAGRLHELLLRGTFVSGASRFRWAGWDAELSGLEAVLATFPDPDPSRPFSADSCVRAILSGPGVRIDLPREIGAKRKFLCRTSYWDVLISAAAGQEPRYVDYSYRERADWYQIPISPGLSARLRQSATLLTYPALSRRIRAATLASADLFTERAPG